jgi:hypothetical protein
MIIGMTEADGFAISMIAILGLSFSFVLAILVGVIRQARKSANDEDALTDEFQDEDPNQPVGDASEKKATEPWEKEADWWKKDS